MHHEGAPGGFEPADHIEIRQLHQHIAVIVVDRLAEGIEVQTYVGDAPVDEVDVPFLEIGEQKEEALLGLQASQRQQPQEKQQKNPFHSTKIQ